MVTVGNWGDMFAVLDLYFSAGGHFRHGFGGGSDVFQLGDHRAGTRDWMPL